MKLGHQEVPKNQPAIGRYLFDTLMRADGPVPAQYISLKIQGATVPVPASEAAKYYPRIVNGEVKDYRFTKDATDPAIDRDPKLGPKAALVEQEASKRFLEDRAALQARVQERGIGIYQRGFGYTNATSTHPYIGTSQLTTCIGLIVYDPSSRQAAVAHYDDNTVTDVHSILEGYAGPDSGFHPDHQLYVSFFGGQVTTEDEDDVSRKICEGLLESLYQADKGKDRITVVRFDVMSRPHSPIVSIDTSDGTILPAFPDKGFPEQGTLDSLFRYLPPKVYLKGIDGRDMAGEVDPRPDLQAASRTMRIHHDRRPEQFEQFKSRVGNAVFASIAATAIGAITEINRGAVEAALRQWSEAQVQGIEKLEKSLKKHISAVRNGVPADQYVVQVVQKEILAHPDGSTVLAALQKGFKWE